ncbi:Actin- protein 2/3 complex subunit 2 [Mortierella sp. AD031]|nr:Actin- protein 2/3 complex subunit 2 [Mortierella sp. AD031]
MKFHDFAGVSYHLSTPEEDHPKQLRLSIHWECWAQLIQYGAMNVLEREYGPWIIQLPESGYDFTMEFSVEDLVGDKDPEDTIRRIALLRRNALAGPFERAFKAQATVQHDDDLTFDSSTIEFMKIDCHRDERMYIRHENQWTRAIIAVDVSNLDEADRMFVTLTFDELKHRSRLPYYSAIAPRVCYYSMMEPPPEIRHLDEVGVGGEHARHRAYITFLISPRHIATVAKREFVISQMMIFWDYLQYHIKCSKGYMNIHMRKEYSRQLKVLHRTRHDYVPPVQTRRPFPLK